MFYIETINAYILLCFVSICIPAATSDATVSLAWCPYDANLLITGQAQKFIRVFDIRGEGSLIASLLHMVLIMRKGGIQFFNLTCPRI